MWRFDLVDSITGNRIRGIDPDAYTGTTALNDQSDGTVGINMNGLDLPTARKVVEDTRPITSVIVQSWVDEANPDGYAVTAGYIGPRSRPAGAWRFDAPTYDLWWMLDRRTGIGPASGASDPSVSRYQISGSFSRYVRRLLEIADNNTEAGDGLPVILPADTNGPRNWDIRGFNSPVIGDLLRDLCAEESGPEIWIQPYWHTGGVFRWRPHVSTSLNKSRTPLDIQIGAAKGLGADIEIAEDISNMGNRITGVGEGSGDKMLMRQAVRSSQYPTIERFVTFKDASTGEQVQRMAAGAADAGLEPWVDYTVSIPAEGLRDHEGNIVPNTGVTALYPGMPVRFFTNVDDPFMGTNEMVTRYLSGYSTNLSNMVTLHLY